MMDIFGGGAPAPAAAAPTELPPMDVYDKSGLKIQFIVRRDAATNTTSVLARFGNMSSMPMTNFVFEAAVPKYLQLKMEPASSQVLAAQSTNVSQNMAVVNTTNGEKPLLMKLRIGYEHNGAPIAEMAQVANFPAGY